MASSTWTAYRVLVISTHPEYWSREMYQAVKSWVLERGGRLAYLGGNGLNCEVTFPDERTMIVHNGDNRQLQADLERYESRFGMRLESEAHLLGVVYSEAGVMTAAPYRVLAADHWALAGTGLAAGDTFGEASPARTDTRRSQRPRDRQDLAQLPGVEHLAKGQNPDDGGADLVHFSTESGGAVFSAGSISWTSSILVDQAVSRITSNVLRRFSQ